MNATKSLRLTCPEDLIAAAPSLLGFYPQNSVVLITAGSPSFQARVDLPEIDDPDDHVEQVTHLLVTPVMRHGIQAVVLLYYCNDKERAARQNASLYAALQAEGVRVPEVLFVTGTHYWSFLAPDMEPQPYDVSGHELLAETVYTGRTIEADRSALDEEVAQDSAAAAQIEATLSEVRLESGANEAVWASRTLAALVEADGTPDDRTTARLILGLARGEVRDVHWVEHSGPDAAAHARVWAGVLRRTPTNHQPAVGSVVAMLRFRSGDGARAWCALDVHEGTHQHSLGTLVHDLLASGASPSEVDQCWSTAPGESA